MNKLVIKKGSFILGILLVLSVVMLVLNHSAKNGRQTTEHLPAISDSPIYVECVPQETLDVEIVVDQDISISGIQVLLVNLSEDSRGSLYVSMKDAAQNTLFEQTLPVNTIVPGEWFTISGEASLIKGECYTISFLPDGSAPYFMKLSDTALKNLPFEQHVIQNRQVLDGKLSLGINQVVPVELTFGEIFYYSIPVSILAAVVSILFVLFGKEKMQGIVLAIPIKNFLQKFGNDLFLLLLFVFSCMGIYAEGYVKGVYITSDSAGYLREAVNLVNGNGFYYDAMAGYDNWFANWPIVYPLMIATVMAVTGMEAYLASKVLTMLLVGLILIGIRMFYKKDAWFYALCVWNLGFVSLTYYTWSEIPFIWFQMLFAMAFARVITQNTPKIREYVLVGVTGLLCFLTRYFGIYVWMVTGIYILYYGWMYLQKKEKVYITKAVALTVTAFVSGTLSLGYLLINKIMNGRASGVSRTLWWDDYEILTNDLIQSLLTEICNVFSMQIPDFIDSYPFNLKLLLLFVLIAGLVIFVVKTCSWESTQGVMITFGICYYVIFIAIRYVSSMDTFYFRFFEPASFLVCLGLFGLLLPFVKNKAWLPYFAGIITVFIILSMSARIQNREFDSKDAYYHTLTAQWDEVYQEIPEKAVVIFNSIDFRSSYYRPDVIGGEIRPEYTFEDVCKIYEGSDYICIKKADAQMMLDSGEYEASMAEKMQEAMEKSLAENAYVVIAMP